MYFNIYQIAQFSPYSTLWQVAPIIIVLNTYSILNSDLIHPACNIFYVMVLKNVIVGN